MGVVVEDFGDFGEAAGGVVEELGGGHVLGEETDGLGD